MELLANGLNGNFLRNILLNAPKTLEWVKVAVAYATGSPELISFCIKNSIPLKFWGRMDESVPVATNILERFLNLGPTYQCKLVWRYYHPKVIWFAGYGAYIGSANLTDTAWNRNIECGVWFDDADLVCFNLLPELEAIFDGIDKVSEPLTQEIINKLKHLEKLIAPSSDYGTASKHVREEFDNTLGKIWSKQFEGLGQISRASFSEKRKSKFLAEWNSTLQLMRQIQELVVLDENRPQWVKSDVPKGVQIDQFLHAYYYTTVKPGLRSLHEEFHQGNKSNTQKALRDAILLWSQLKSPPNDEDTMMYERAPYLYEHLSSQGLLELTENEFVEVCKRIHAFVTAARQTRNEEIGLPADTHIDLVTRAEKVARWIWLQRTTTGADPIGVLRHVLYGGSPDDITGRIWDAAFTAGWHLPRFGLSCIGEIVGWAMPDTFPPRNGRTSKALYALGFDVTLYSE